MSDDYLSLVIPDLNDESHLRFLYEILKERHELGYVNIDDRPLHSYEEHVKYLQTTNKYKDMFFASRNGLRGMAYLTIENEMGVFVKKEYIGYKTGPWLISALVDRHPNVRIWARVNTENRHSNKFIQHMGFEHIANVWQIGSQIK